MTTNVLRATLVQRDASPPLAARNTSQSHSSQKHAMFARAMFALPQARGTYTSSGRRVGAALCSEKKTHTDGRRCARPLPSCTSHGEACGYYIIVTSHTIYSTFIIVCHIRLAAIIDALIIIIIINLQSIE